MQLCPVVTPGCHGQLPKKGIQVGKQHGKQQKESALLTGSQGLTATSFLQAGWGKHLPRNNRYDQLQSLGRDGTKVRPSCDSFAR